MVNIQLHRTSFFPGNLVTGNVSMFNGNCQVLFVAELYQHWTTTQTYHTGSGKNRRTHTRTIHHYNNTNLINMYIPVNPDGSFAFQLDFGCVPSIVGVEKYQLRYYVKAVDGSGNQSSPAPFQILAPMQAVAWQANSSRQENQVKEVTCCCCCDSGKLKITFRMAKTNIALDRDQVCVEADLDASECEEDIEAFTVILNCVGNVKTGHICSFTDSAGSAKVPADCKRGQKKTVQCVVNLRNNAAPTVTSPILDINYFITANVNMESLLVSDISSSFPVYVAHSVDPNSFNFQQYWQQSNFFQPGMAANGSPIMYQAPTQNAFEMAPPAQFSQGPPIEFANWETGTKEVDS